MRLSAAPKLRYQAGLKGDTASLKRLFATEERRKMTREATVRLRNRRLQVPEKQIDWSVWVANSFDQHVKVRAGSRIISTFQLWDSGSIGTIRF